MTRDREGPIHRAVLSWLRAVLPEALRLSSAPLAEAVQGQELVILASPVAGRAFMVIVWASRSSAQSLSPGSGGAEG